MATNKQAASYAEQIAALREENARLNQKLDRELRNHSLYESSLRDRNERLTREREEAEKERDDARDQVAALKTDNYRINKHRDELEAERDAARAEMALQAELLDLHAGGATRAEAEVVRLEGLILDWSNDASTYRWPEAALEAEARRIRAQRKPSDQERVDAKRAYADASNQDAIAAEAEVEQWKRNVDLTGAELRDAETAVARLEGLILAWDRECGPDELLEAEARRIRAQREEGRCSAGVKGCGILFDEHGHTEEGR